MPLPKKWTWLVLLLCTTSVIVVTDIVSKPPPAVALDDQTDSGLSEPVAPVLARQRKTKSVLKQIAWPAVRERMGADLPTGRGIPVAIVEGTRRGYVPRIDADQFVGKRLIPEVETDPDNNKPSGHSGTVLKFMVGKDGPAFDITDVHCWPTQEWIGSGYLNTGTLDAPKPDHPARVFNHSWISPEAEAAPLILRRVDYVVDQYDKIIVCGVNNGKGEVPALLASAYNVISVGVKAGNNSDGLTTIEGEGRCKPELVAPGPATSFSTPVVTGSIATMLELADRMIAQDPQANKDAARSETIKSILLAGARRPREWSTVEKEPLDRAIGAGILDIDRALLILESGHVAPDLPKPITRRYAWSFAQIVPGQSREYKFHIKKKQAEVGFSLVWNRKVLGGLLKLRNKETNEERVMWNHANFVPNIDMKLVRHIDEQTTEQVAISHSAVDNLELIHLRPLEPGIYTLTVSRAPDKTRAVWDYSLAWRIEAHSDPADEPLEEDGKP